MSKSLGNGIDPWEIIAEYGADPLRFSLITGNSAGNDMRFSVEKVESARNFCNKIYNAARFVLMNLDDDTPEGINWQSLDLADKWILHRLNEVIASVTTNLDSFDLNVAAEKIYDFIWSEFCDWYIEMSKQALYSKDKPCRDRVSAVLIRVLGDCMKLLHPFMPFITEELYQQLPGAEKTIMRAAWPVFDSQLQFDAEAAAMNAVMDLIRQIRNIRAERHVAPSQRITLRLSCQNNMSLAGTESYFIKLAGAEQVIIDDSIGEIAQSDIHLIGDGVEAVIPLASLVDFDKEKERLDKEIARMNAEIMRAESKLANPSFVSKAPAAVVEEEQKKLASAHDILQKLLDRRSGL